jgi:hypothetical protein
VTENIHFSFSCSFFYKGKLHSLTYSVWGPLNDYKYLADRPLRERRILTQTPNIFHFENFLGGGGGGCIMEITFDLKLCTPVARLIPLGI